MLWYPNTLNLDPDPGLWPNLDLDPDPGLYVLSILKEKIQNYFREKLFSLKQVGIFLNYEKKLSP